MYAQQLVGVIEAHCAGETVEDKTIRTIAAVVFKNLVKAKWAPEVENDSKVAVGTAVVLPATRGKYCTCIHYGSSEVLRLAVRCVFCLHFI